MEDKEIEEKIWKELKRIADMIERTVVEAEEMRNKEIHIEAKKITIYEEIKEWLDNSLREAIMSEVRDFSAKIRENPDDVYELLSRISKIISLKRTIEQLLSEDGMLYLDKKMERSIQRKVNK